MYVLIYIEQNWKVTENRTVITPWDENKVDGGQVCENTCH